MDGKVLQHQNIPCLPNIPLSSCLFPQVGVKTIARTFASGKTEKLVYQVFCNPLKTLNQSNDKLMQTLADCGLPNGKGDSIEHSAFTFEVLFHTNISRDFQQGKPNWRADGRTHENYEIIWKSPKMNPSKVKFPLI